ncbi:MAG: pirin family protein, partial [Myxococcales bacterium]|nr:pirin family protein [Myxococcales bacterium]
DMEILTYVLDGEIAHKDSMGNGSTIHPGEVQRMTAGTGVTHSEFNHARDATTRFLQIWVVPERRGLTPGYEQRRFDDERRGRLRLVVSPDGRDGSLRVHQELAMYASLLAPGESVTHDVAAGKRVWIQVVRGRLRVGDEQLDAGDGAATPTPSDGADALTITAEDDSELLLFELP